MVFSSLFFLYAFLPLSLLVYCLCPSLKAKNISLLVFSLIFYAWGEPKYVLLLMFMALVDWFCALKISQALAEDIRQRKLWVLIACIVDLGLIGWFKYSAMIVSIFTTPPPFIQNIALPIGISFYTFQLLTYVVDVYRNEAPAQKQYWYVLLYASLFHQCIAGPIIRYQSVAEELFVARDAFKDLPSGVTRFSLGLVKKVVLANGCGILADKFLIADSALADAAAAGANLATLASTPALGLWLGVASLALQMYFDFSAYSDMAIGMGRMLGIHYTENFIYPYISHSFTEFWNRWHLTLSTFFRDYVYYPLGGSRKGKARSYLNLLIVWALTGLWHGASWNFVLWGLYFFFFIIIEKLFLLKLFEKLPKPLYEVLPRLYFIFVLLLEWPLFKYTDMSMAMAVIKGLFCLNGNSLTGFEALTVLKNNVFFIIFAVIACTPVFKIIGERWHKAAEGRAGLMAAYNAVTYGIIPVSFLLISTAYLVGNSYNPFLYFKF